MLLVMVGDGACTLLGTGNAGLEALVAKCRRDFGEVYRLPSPVSDDVIEATAVSRPGGLGFDHLATLQGDSCASLRVTSRLEGSPPRPDPTDSSRPPFGWYRVSYSAGESVRYSDGVKVRETYPSGEGWVYFGIHYGAPYFETPADRAQDAEIRQALSHLPIATFADGGSNFDLEAGAVTLSLVGSSCVVVGMHFRDNAWVAVTNVGPDIGPRVFDIGISETGATERMETVVLLRGLEPGESLQFGPFTNASVRIDPDQRLVETSEDNNETRASGAELICVKV